MRILTALERVAIWHIAETPPPTGGNDFDPLGVTTRLKGEFDNWASPLAAAGKIGPYPKNLVTHWPYVEQFMKEKYPAAHKGFDMGMEQARPALTYSISTYGKPPDKHNSGYEKYEMGPEAISKYGYDPSEIAAGMLLLHNSGRASAEAGGLDEKHLVEIYKKRHQMQQQYDQKMEMAV